MNVRTAAAGLIGLFFFPALHGQSIDPNTLLSATIKTGALAETLTAFCAQKNAGSAPQYQTELAAWRQRNHWEAIRAKAAPGTYEAARTTASQSLTRQGERVMILCLDMHASLTNPTFDPSQRYSDELAQLAAQGGAAQARPNPQPQMQSPMQPQAAPPAVSPAGGAIQIGDATLFIPASWRRSKSSATEVVFQRPTKSRDEMQLFAFEQTPLQGDLKSAFAAAVRSSWPGTPPKLEHIETAVTRSGLPAVYARDGSQLNSTHRSAALRAVGVALPNGQLFLVLLLSTDSYGSLSEAEKELTAVVSSMTFRSQPAGATWDPLTKHGSGSARGLYWYNTLTVMPNAFGGMDTRAIRRYVLLLPGGRALNDLPEDGHVLDVDFAAFCAKHTEGCGSYSVEGGTIRFRWPGDFGLTEETSGAYIAGQSLETKGEKYSAIAPVENLRINGRYRSFFASSGMTAMGSGSVSSEKFITLTPDGRYQKQGFSGASFTNSGAAGTFGNQKGLETGTYQINGYTMTLTPQSGQPQTYTILVDKPGLHPSALFINDESYLP